MIKKSNLKKFTARMFLIGFFLFSALCSMAYAETATIAWDPNPEPDIYGYKVFYGTESRNYTETVEVIGANNTTVTINGLLPGNTYYFAVKAVDLAGQESDFSDEVSRTYELPNTAPAAHLDLDTVSGFAPLTANFSGAGSTDSDGSIVEYVWNFGDGTTAYGVDASHTFNAPGTYTVTLTVTDDDGAADTATAQIEVKQGYTYTWVLGDNTGADLMGTCQDTYININDENYATSESLRTYTWPTDTAANAIIMKWNLEALPQDAEIRSATLELYLNEAGGDEAYDISAHRIIGVDPVIDACTGETWDGTTAWTNGTALAQDNIDEAQGVTTVDTEPGFKAWDITNIARTWIEAPDNNYGVLLNADTTAASDSFRYFASSQASDAATRPRLTITFVSEQQLDLPPRAKAAADTLTGKAPLTVNFSAEGSHDTEGNLEYSWDFGDGTTGNGITAVHEYASVGTFTAVLTVTDTAGQTDTAELTITTVPNQPPQAAATADVTAGEAPLTVLFDAGASQDSDGNIVSWSWDFNGDGVEDAQGITVEHTFTEAGEYHVTLTVTDDSGASSRDSDIIITVTSNKPPVIGNFTATPDALNNPKMTATFNADISDPENGDITVSIDFGNGQSAATLPAQCTYNQTGTYNVTLTVTDDHGNEATATLQMVVTDQKPQKPFNITLVAE